MTDPHPSERPVRVDGILPFLPEGPPFRRWVEAVLSASSPDPGRRWTGSGELGTVGSRVLDPDRVRGALERLAAEEAQAGARRIRALTGVVEGLSGGGDPERAVGLLLDAGGEAEGEARFEEAEGWYLAARALALAQGSPRRSEALRRAARTARARAELDLAARRYAEAAREADASDRTEDAVVARTGRGNVAVERGDWDDADGWYRAALADAGRGGFEGPAGARLRWPLAQNLAILARERGRLDEAEGWLREGEEWAAEADAHARAEGRDPDPGHRLDFPNGWGQLALARGDLPLAEAHFRRALEGPGPPLSRVGVLVNLAETLLRSGRGLDAGAVARQAELEALAGGAPGRLPEIYRLLARVAREREEPGAHVFLERALELARARSLPVREEAKTLRAWAELLREEGDEERAREAEALARTLESRGERSGERPAVPAPPASPENASPENASPETLPDETLPEDSP
jgi:tetratricopeptide (TPR) repeat protein